MMCERSGPRQGRTKDFPNITLYQNIHNKFTKDSLNLKILKDIKSYQNLKIHKDIKSYQNLKILKDIKDIRS